MPHQIDMTNGRANIAYLGSNRQSTEGKMALTEDTIELRVERHIDHVDRLFLTGAIDQETYDKCIRDIHERAEAQYAAMMRCK